MCLELGQDSQVDFSQKKSRNLMTRERSSKVRSDSKISFRKAPLHSEESLSGGEKTVARKKMPSETFYNLFFIQPRQWLLRTLIKRYTLSLDNTIERRNIKHSEKGKGRGKGGEGEKKRTVGHK